MTLRVDDMVAGWEKMRNEGAAGELAGAMGMYRRMVLGVLLAMLERFERDPGYGFLDMKVDLITGEDFAEADEVRGKGTIYAWIQGRGLEALAGHAMWVASGGSGELLDEAQRRELVARIKVAARRVVERMEELRAANGGRLSFMMRSNGEALRVVDGRVVPKGPPEGGTPNVGMSDLFYGKGLAAAAWMLGDEKRKAEAVGILRRVVEAVRAGKFVSDQEQLDVKNPVGPVAGRFGHGSRMILIGAAALMVELTGEEEWVKLGEEMIPHIFGGHVKGVANKYKDGIGEDFAMWEFVDGEGRQYLEQGKLRSDPGHATEFVGLALKFLRVCEEKGCLGQMKRDSLRGGLRGLLGRVLTKNFANGFSKRGIGICKAFDLAGRKAMNTDMPWWNLPETMRAGMEAAAGARDDAERREFLEIVRKCSNVFMKYYVRADRWLMANQTVDEAGKVAARVPATPDADPGYHTGLSLIDALGIWEKLGEKGR